MVMSLGVAAAQEPQADLGAADKERQAAAAGETFPVAILRLDKVLKDNVELQRRLAPLKAEAVELEKTIEIRKSELETTESKLARSQPGTSEFENLRRQSGRLRTELAMYVQHEVSPKRQKLAEREGQELYAVYQELEKVVADYCKERGIRLVLRHQEPPAGEPNLQTIMNALNRGVVYADNLDITADIEKRLAERQTSESRK